MWEWESSSAAAEEQKDKEEWETFDVENFIDSSLTPTKYGKYVESFSLLEKVESISIIAD